MTVKTYNIHVEKETIMDDISNKEGLSLEIDQDKLAQLKARLAAKEQKEARAMNTKPDKSIVFSVIGTGHGGGKLACEFYKYGYDAIAINTANQDLKFLELPETNKLLLDFTIGGSGKDLSIGHQAAEANKDKITNLINTQLSNSHAFILATSLGGGSGAGSCEVILDILASKERPIIVIAVLPMTSEDSQTKDNALQTLAKLAKLTQNKKIHNLVVVDNAKIEAIYSGVSQIDFFGIANKSIVDPIDAFNKYSAMPSSVKSLDGVELAKLLFDGGGLCAYGALKVSNYQEEDALALAVIENLSSNLLADGFDLKQSRYVGVMFVANKQVWSKIPAANINYSVAMINDQCGSPLGVFKGIYEDNSLTEDEVIIYSMFSGLALPDSRVAQLKNEVKDLVSANKTKDVARNLSLNLDTGKDATTTKAEELKNKISQKNSAFGKFISSTVVDRRK